MSPGIKIGIIGTGRMAYWHLKGLRKISGVDVVAIAGRTAENVEILRRKFRVPHGYTDYRQLLIENKLDAVSITTPTNTHCSIAVDCLNAGVHVLCEKPLAMTLDEADMMINAEKKSGKLLMPGFSQRFYKEFIRMKSMVDRGDLGRIRVAWFRRGINLPSQKWYADKESSPGVTFELAIHAIDWLRWIIPSPVEHVSAEMTLSEDDSGIDDNVWMLLKFSSGAVGVVGASYTFPYLKRDIGIIGEKMALSVERSKVVCERFGSHSLGSMLLKNVLHSFILPYWLYYNPFERELREFCSCIVNGTAPSVSSLDGRQSVAIACAAYESVRVGTKVTLS